MVAYPRKGEERQLKISQDRKCKFCEQVAIRRVCIEWSWFRGDDDVVNVCTEHSKWKNLQPPSITVGEQATTLSELDRQPAPDAGEEEEQCR